ncbi:hypothetical protein GS610_08125 [Ruegeria sp. HKCCD6228]|uniref:hypothetical protein n=1 Tax=Ruegeria sp. HKCCD6228 TaxID=2683001 RepID=UPI00149269E1|nr:hypothetical protein [Ruegeria sp. HKCCD6228]NOD97174.1 hypothetical protein [Ruegeria sp. HKCCD6228]
MIDNVTRWDIAVRVHSAGHIRKGIILGWLPGMDNDHMPVTHGLNDANQDGELVIVNSSTGQAYWCQQIAPSLEDMVEVIKHRGFPKPVAE